MHLVAAFPGAEQPEDSGNNINNVKIIVVTGDARTPDRRAYP